MTTKDERLVNYFVVGQKGARLFNLLLYTLRVTVTSHGGLKND
jgi:hypothetical protein